MKNSQSSAGALPAWNTVKVSFEDGIAWVVLNRPEKRNAMSPTLNREMLEVLEALEFDDRARVLVLTGEGEAFTAGMDLKEYFREVEGLPPAKEAAIRRAAGAWQWRKLMYYPKPTIAMVNGWAFGGAFTPLIACDLAIAADEAQLGLSEINWGIIPAGNVTRAVAGVMNQRDSLYYIMTGEPFSGKKAAEMGLVNESVPLAQLRERVVALAKVLLSKNPTVLNAAKLAYKHCRDMHWDQSEDYLVAKAAQTAATDLEGGRTAGLSQFLDEKSYRPGLGAYNRKGG
ncbi:MAG: p-hydroxycinnamoyl CoA hydratase/lyase [Thauera sp.]|jgi:trans-feruloyl-CoA hydratase/vanillin synthase|nr:p-hydroxycinnamoyl CoA hydratase/lyase [Thauera sp.]